MLAATSMPPLGSMAKVRGCMPRTSAFGISGGIAGPLVDGEDRPIVFAAGKHFLAAMVHDIGVAIGLIE
jgi:hypothetical protein